MTALVWDAVGERRYETGVDHGVLYSSDDGGAVVWNGLTSVTENSSSQVNPFYLDGAKYLDQQVLGAYGAKLQAITYPDELEKYLGVIDYDVGVRLHDQKARPFHLSYRTLVGTDTDPDHGFKIHVIYNILATPSDVASGSIEDKITPVPFEWDLASVPVRITGHNPTSHISFDSTELSLAQLTALQTALYGSSGADAALPSLADLIALVADA